VHRGNEQELVVVDLEQVAEQALARRRRVERRVGIAALELVEDDARVLEDLVLGRDEHRNLREPRARPDHLAVGGRRRQDLVERHVLVAQRRPRLRREVGDLGGVEAMATLSRHGSIPRPRRARRS
jgi:hypothetical protein